MKVEVCSSTKPKCQEEDGICDVDIVLVDYIFCHKLNIYLDIILHVNLYDKI